jgi:hypothetical protein
MKTLTSSFIGAAIISISYAPNAMAHEGHGDPSLHASLLHYIGEPVHLIATLVIVGAVVAASRWAAGLRGQS